MWSDREVIDLITPYTSAESSKTNSRDKSQNHENEIVKLEATIFGNQLTERLQELHVKQEAVDTEPGSSSAQAAPRMEILDPVIGQCFFCGKEIPNTERHMDSYSGVYHTACLYNQHRKAALDAPSMYTATRIYGDLPKNIVCPAPECEQRTAYLAEMLSHVREEHPRQYADECEALGGVKCDECGQVYTQKTIAQHTGRAHKKNTKTTGKKRKDRPLEEGECGSGWLPITTPSTDQKIMIVKGRIRPNPNYVPSRPRSAPFNTFKGMDKDEDKNHE